MVAAPLTSLLKGERKMLVWSEAASDAFPKLKQRFCMGSVLEQLNPEEPLIVEMDASEVGVGAMLL